MLQLFQFWLQEEILIRAVSVCWCLGSLWRRCVPAAFFPTRWWNCERGDELHAITAVLPRVLRWGCLDPPEELALHSLLCSPLGLQLHAGNLPISFVLAKTSPSLSLLQVTDLFLSHKIPSVLVSAVTSVVFWFCQNWWGDFSLMLLKLLKVFQLNPF